MLNIGSTSLPGISLFMYKLLSIICLIPNVAPGTNSIPDLLKLPNHDMTPSLSVFASKFIRKFCIQTTVVFQSEFQCAGRNCRQRRRAQICQHADILNESNPVRDVKL